MGKVNYKQIFAKKAKNEEKIKSLCPEATHTSGIYVLSRTNEEGFRFAYIGQATKSLLTRLAQHLEGYSQHIDLSIKKWGLFDQQKNPYGYRVGIVCYCKPEQCDKEEQLAIKRWADNGWQMRNTTGGSQGQGKFNINDNKPSKGYRDGIAQGKKTLAKELLHIIETHLVITLKKDTKISQKALQKFYSLLNPKKEEETTEN